MLRPSNLCARVILSLCALALPTLATAQASRHGNTFSLGGTTVPVRDPDVAFNTLNGTYMQVAGNGFIEAHLVGPAGLLNRVRVNASAEYAAAPRIAFSPHIGTAGGYLVTWHATIGNYARVRGKLISATGAWLSGDIEIAISAVSAASSTNWTMGAAVAYATGSREFLVAWMGSYNVANDIHFARVSTAGALLPNPGGHLNLQATSAVPDWERDPAVAYNPDTDEFYIAYAGFSEAGRYAYVGGRRVKAGTGAFVGAPQSFGATAATYVPAVTYNTQTRQFLIGWYHASSNAAAVYGVVVNGADGSLVGGLRVLSPYYFAYDALDIDYNAPSGQYLLVTHGRNWEDAAVSILANGVGYDNGFLATNTPDVRPVGNPAAEGNFAPRLASSTTERKWLLVTSNKFTAVYAQYVISGATAGQPPPPPPPAPPPPPPPPPPCAVEPHPDQRSLSLSGAAQSRSIQITASTSTCPWSGSSSAGWLVITSGSSGAGPGTMIVTASRNTTGAPRTATLTITGGTVTVQQAVSRGNAALHDISGDGASDIVWHNASTGQVAAWNLNGNTVTATYNITPGGVDRNWRIVGSGDLNGDGVADLVWRNGAGAVAVWFLQGGNIVGTQYLSMFGTTVTRLDDAGWEVGAVGDLDGDGQSDLVWQHPDGRLAVWLMSGGTVRSTAALSRNMPDPSWRIAAAADLNGDGRADLVWQNRGNGGLGAWLMAGNQVLGQSNLSIERVTDLNWKVRGAGDTNGDGMADLIWQNTATGALAVWYLNQFTVVGTRWLSIPAVGDLNWHVVGPG